MKVMICANLAKERSRKAAADACAKLNEIGFLPMIEKQYENIIKVDNAVYAETDSLITDCDMFMTIGGDGTILKWGQKAAACNKLLLGINTGRLGFMTTCSVQELPLLAYALQEGSYQTDERAMLEVTRIRVDGVPESIRKLALNEVSLIRAQTGKMVDLDAEIDGELLNRYHADGVLVSTPTGSTAYSLSVGGPVIVPHSKTIAITPVAPHSLNVRPIVICDDWEITLDVESRSHNFLVAVDGRSESCKETTRLTISRADYSIKVVKRFNHIFFDTLRNKMMWGADVR